MSVPEPLGALADIQQTVLVHQGEQRRPHTAITMAALPAAWAPLEAALRQRRPVRLSYHGRQRLVCPHALGWKNGRPMLLAYQTGGHTSTGTLPADPRRRWRCMFVDEVDQVDATDPASAWGTADNYNHTHPFHAIDNVTIAITPGDPPHAS